jgi:predicted aspartyl protease
MPGKKSINDIQEEMPEDINSFLARRGYLAIPIVQNATGLLLVTVVVNDVPGLFILDTGAGISVVESNHAERFKLNLQNDDTSFTGAGAGGQGLKVIPSTGNKIEIGDYTITDLTLSTMSLEHVSQALAELGANEEILGIIGVDILKPARAIIDYSSMTLYLSLKSES